MSSTFEYRFEVWAIAADGTTTLVEAGTVSLGTDRAIYSIRSALGEGGSYRWRVRAELGGVRRSVVRLGHVHLRFRQG